MAASTKIKTTKPKSSKKTSKKALHVEEEAPSSIIASKVDPALAALFTSSAGPVRVPTKTRYSAPRAAPPAETQRQDDDDGNDDDGSPHEELTDGKGIDAAEDDILEDAGAPSESQLQENLKIGAANSTITKEDSHKRKRKRGAQIDDLEGQHLGRIARIEEKEELQRVLERAERHKKRRVIEKDGDTATARSPSERSEGDDGSDVNHDDDEDESTVPQHEILTSAKEVDEVEKATRTVFLGNVSTSAIISKSAKKTLMDYLSSILPTLDAPRDGQPRHKLESLRFRSTAFSSGKVPRKVAFARKELMDSTTKSTNAYAVYSTAYAARETVKKLNGSMILDRHLRVDSVAHPAKTDHRRCVFVGNLGFVDDESAMEAGDMYSTRKKSSKPPGDVEEGLWRQFGKSGTVESVRVVRDPKTRVGKGFAYVQFTVSYPRKILETHPKLTRQHKDANAVEKALLDNEKKFPPLLPRKLRVTRAKDIRKTASAMIAKPGSRQSQSGDPSKIYNPKTSSEKQSFNGRAGKLLGRAGAARARTDEQANGLGKSSTSGFKAPESIVFEGYRASRNQGKSGLKLGGPGKKSGKPRTKSSLRAATWKSSGGKKA